MLIFRDDVESGIVELTINGTISKTEFDDVATKLQAIIKERGKVRLLEEIKGFSGIEPSAIWDDIRFSFNHLNDFSRVAVVTDKSWIEWWTKAVSPFISVEVELFEPSEIEAARDWLMRDEEA